MFKKSLVVASILLVASAAIALCNLDDMVRSGAMGARISQFEGQGWFVTGVEYTQINYFMAPTPPFQDGTVTVHLVTEVDLGNGTSTRALATITGEAWVQKNGNCKIANITVN